MLLADWAILLTLQNGKRKSREIGQNDIRCQQIFTPNVCFK